MKQYHHIGLPNQKKRENETYLEGAKLYITDAGASDYGVEWLRFEPDSPMPELLKTTAHVAFMVDDLDAAMAGKQILLEPFVPLEGLRVGFIVEDGAPIELMQATTGKD
jgi:hypothetical protein